MYGVKIPSIIEGSDKKEVMMEPKEPTLSDIFNKDNYINESVIQEAVSKHGGILFMGKGSTNAVDNWEKELERVMKRKRRKIVK